MKVAAQKWVEQIHWLKGEKMRGIRQQDRVSRTVMICIEKGSKGKAKNRPYIQNYFIIASSLIVF